MFSKKLRVQSRKHTNGEIKNGVKDDVKNYEKNNFHRKNNFVMHRRFRERITTAELEIDFLLLLTYLVTIKTTDVYET